MAEAKPAGRTAPGPAGPAAAVVASREARLFVALAGLFVTNALIAEFVGVKIFAMEDTLGIEPLDWRLFGQSGSLSFTAGVMLWPIVNTEMNFTTSTNRVRKKITPKMKSR